MNPLSKDDRLFRQPGAEGGGDPAALLHGDVTDGDEGTDIQGAHSREGWKRETWLIYRLMKGSFSSKSSNHHKSQTIRALGTWKFLQNVHHMSCVMCHMSPVTCHLSLVKKILKKNNNNIFLWFLDKLVELVGRGSVINGASWPVVSICRNVRMCVWLSVCAIACIPYPSDPIFP